MKLRLQKNEIGNKTTESEEYEGWKNCEKIDRIHDKSV